MHFLKIFLFCENGNLTILLNSDALRLPVSMPLAGMSSRVVMPASMSNRVRAFDTAPHPLDGALLQPVLRLF